MPETQTDTETVAQLTGHLMGQGMSPVEAVRATLERLHGAFALAFLFVRALGESEREDERAERFGTPA